jgi:hypothetical protein
VRGVGIKQNIAISEIVRMNSGTVVPFLFPIMGIRRKVPGTF